MCVRPQPATQRGQRWLRSLGRPSAWGPRTRRRPSDAKTDPSCASQPSASRRQSRPAWPRPRPGAPLVRTARTVHTRAHTQCVHAHTHLHGHPCAQARAHARRGTRADHARTCRLRAAHARTSIRQVVTPRPRPPPSAAPQLRDVHGLHSRLSTDLRRRLERARMHGAFFCSRWGVFVANPSTQRREHERKFRPCHRVEQDGGPGLEGPLPRASRTPPGVRASRPSPPSDLECPPWPAAEGLSRGRHRTSAAGRTARSRACDRAICEDRVFLQEPRWAVREAGSGRARAGRACVRGAAGGGAGSQRRPWSFAGAHAERLPLSAARCSHPRGANAGAPNTREKLRAQTRRFLRTGGRDGRGPRRLL